MGGTVLRPWLVAMALLLAAGVIRGGMSYEHPTFNKPSAAGGAGYALLFHDNVIVKNDFKDFPSTELTFEAWLSTSDMCHRGAIMSYAKHSTSTNEHQRTQDFNHFVIFDPSNVLACHDFEYIDYNPDLEHKSCHSRYGDDGIGLDGMSPTTATFLSRTGDWHHIAVTWSAAERGLMQIYQDGLLVAKAVTDKTDPLVPDGSFMLGGEQDCYGGCTDPRQGYYGFMDDVRIWKTVRNQTQIINDMRKKYEDMEDRTGLVAYWNFDDVETLDANGFTKDVSLNGNDLDLLTPPANEDMPILGNDIDGKPQELIAGALKFKNSYARATIENMPTKSISVEFWAKTVLADSDPKDSVSNERYAEFVSFATQSKGDGNINNNNGLADTVFMDDAIRIERYLTEFNNSEYLKYTKISTLGAISVHINANRQGNGRHANNWVDFATEWTDNEWHHVAVTWDYDTGNVQLFFDGYSYTPFWRSAEGEVTDRDPNMGGVSRSIAKKVERLPTGSLVLGQNQECFGGCFSPGTAYDGYLANLRVWNKVLDIDQIKRNMFVNDPVDTSGLALSYTFKRDRIQGDNDRDLEVLEMTNNKKNKLILGSIGPSYEYSYAPLTDRNFIPLEGPSPGYSGYAMKVHDEQVLIKQDFFDFPQDAITVEFWMWSIDTCWQGVPFSYAHGDYEKLDNAFLIFNYNNWGVSIMELEGNIDDHNAGFGATDGKWHHIAVTWESKTGEVSLYDNGRQAWKVKRAQGKKIPPGGTLILGREQDCLGGCFDSRYGAAGDVQPWIELEYGAQDFFGVMDQIRIWKVKRTPDEIHKGMLADQDNGSGKKNDFINPKDSNLVAYWKFDEGTGYIVHDETPRKNHLYIMEEPDWMVMRWMMRCSNGILEGVEKCDDGNQENGDGCSKACMVEDGFVCTPTSPSKCTRNGPHTGKSGAGWTMLFVAIVAVGIIIVAAVAYRKREYFYDHFPQLEQMVHTSTDKLGKMMGRRQGYDGVLSLDPESEMDHPGFVNAQVPATYQPPGRPIPYTPMPDAGNN